MGNRAEREFRNKDPQTAAIISNYHNELRDLNRRLKEGLISKAAHKEERKPIVTHLHQVMRESGRKPVRTKNKHH